MIRLGLRLTPHGRLVCELVADAPGLDEAVATRLREAFARGSGDGLLRLGAGEVGQALPPVFVWWRAHSSHHSAPAIFGMNTPAFDTASAKFCISGASLCSGMFGMRS